MSGLANQVVAIVGGSSGIGMESALLFATQGTQTLLIARGRERLRESVDEIRANGGKAQEFPADITSPDEVIQLANQIRSQFGRVDVLIYGAAEFYLSPVEMMDCGLAKHAMEVNYWGAVNVTKAFLPLIRNGERKTIVFISSLSVPCTPPFFAAYAATKHALRGLALSLRQELKPEGIRVQMITPGPVDTPLIENYLHRGMYRLPPGIPVLQPRITAKQIYKAVIQRKQDVVVPKRMGWAARLAYAFPSLVESYYRLSVPDWSQSIQTQIEKHKHRTLEPHPTVVQSNSTVTTSEPEE
ncbi:SDR family NAD(P)-dependent oxidoreductase [Alicyclobacillus dauci]|uniref:SDR family oxidoreductase n=1 Tax=Alicyclobacillus dauci TaxID=1475485 RepID=A0ABY6YZD2_9BACL|nr:SDR family oxidoreductase [Alicyclobacillus dauci]WAH35982.1 SDR family oxidoreductase [Alicyclobacillus dauci]